MARPSTVMRRYFATSTKAWRAERSRDHYANNCVRSRAEFKLSELQDKFGILRRGQNVVDLGAAPGGFSLVAARVIRLRERHPTLSSWNFPVRPGDTIGELQITRSFGGHQRRRGYGRLVCVDMNEMDEIEGDARFVRGDVRDEAIHAAMVRALNCEEADVILSDMAPRTATDVETSHFRSIELARAALTAADAVLRSGGAMVVKLFAGTEEAQFREEMRDRFVKVRAYKPKASKKRSVEHYLIGDGFVPLELRSKDEVHGGDDDGDTYGSCNVSVGLAQVVLARDGINR